MIAVVLNAGVPSDLPEETMTGIYVRRKQEEGHCVGNQQVGGGLKKVVDVNLTGVFLTVRECAEQMISHNCRGLICLVSSTGSLGTADQINYSSTKAAVSMFPKVITAEFFRRGLADKILETEPIGRLIAPVEIASRVGKLYRNVALAGDVYFIHSGLRLGPRD